MWNRIRKPWVCASIQHPSCWKSIEWCAKMLNVTETFRSYETKDVQNNLKFFDNNAAARGSHCADSNAADYQSTNNCWTNVLFGAH